MFLLPRISYLDTIIDVNGSTPDPNKTAGLQFFPAPSNKATLQPFYGTVNYFDNFVPDIQSLRVPLNNLLRKKTKFFWPSQCRNAVEKNKNALISDLVRTRYNPQLPIIVADDTNDHMMSAVLLHKLPKGVRKRCHVSRMFVKAERKYS